MATAKKSASGARELITPHKGDSRYQRRNADGTLAESDKVSRSQAADKAKKAKTVAPKGQGDKGDHPPAKKAAKKVAKKAAKKTAKKAAKKSAKKAAKKTTGKK